MEDLNERVKKLEDSIILEEEIGNLKRRISKIENNQKVDWVILVGLLVAVFYLLFS